MRLSQNDGNIIRSVTKDVFGADARVLLFGSRADDAQKGGDIDLLVEAQGTDEQLFMKKLKALSIIQLKIGERKIDLVTTTPAQQTTTSAIVREALDKGIEL